MNKRRDIGHLQITERDQLVLTWIAEQYSVSYDHIQKLLALYSSAETKNPQQVAYSTAMNAVQRWLQMSFIEQPHKIVRELPTHLWLSRKGIKELELPYSFYQPKTGTIKHFYAVNAVRLNLQIHHIDAQWKSQRFLHRDSSQAPLPDAELQFSNMPLVAIQVIESTAITASLLDELKTLSVLLKRYEHIWYFLQKESLESMRSITTMLSSQERERIVFYELNRAPVP